MCSQLHVDALCLTEGKKCPFGPMSVRIVVVPPEEGAMDGYPAVHIPDKDHRDVNKVASRNDPTFTAISEFIHKQFTQS